MFSFFSDKFAYPWILILIPIAILLWFVWFYKQYSKNNSALTISSMKGMENHFSIRGQLRKVLPFLRLLAVVFLLIAVARPQVSNTEKKGSIYGIDIVFSFDVSSSMLAQDFSPNRLEVAKDVALKFVKGRLNDRFGLVLFAGESFPQVPITSDRNVIRTQIENVDYGLLEDGTAIGMGIGSAVNRLIASDSESKVVILMTDGVNNAGKIDPITAAEAAIQYDVKIYTIGIGSKGQAYMPVGKNHNGQWVYDYATVQIDEELLTKVADMTGGKYFRAENEKALATIYGEIDKLEKTEVESSVRVRVDERFHLFAFMASLFLLVEFILNYTLLRYFP